MPLLLGLQSLEPLIIVNALALADALKHVLNTRHHSFETTEVDMGTVVKLVENLVGVLLNLVLDVHLSTVLILLLTRESIVNAKIVGGSLLGSLELVVVKEGIAVGHTKEQPGLTFVGVSGGSVLSKETADETTVRGDASSGRNHNEVGFWVLLRHEHNLASGAGQLNVVTRLGVAEKVGADALLRWVIGL